MVTKPNMKDVFSDLNAAQKKAVEHTEGPLLVFAGAGSGKTRVLTRRIANLIQNHGVHPANILAVTFTNKAAAEMRNRVATLLGRNINGMWIATFHSACVRILRNHATDLGYSSQFAIYDSSDSKAVMKRVYKQIGIDPRIIERKTVLSTIDKSKNSFMDPEDLRHSALLPDNMIELVADLYQAYQDELQSCNAMDFGDLLCNTLSLIKIDSTVRDKYRQQFKYILVDEYQDTNEVQYQLINLLAAEHKNLCVVGDDDQSIYAFRGATIKNILSFSEDYKDAVTVTLDTNYRSTQNILKVANSIIAPNKARQEKTMVTGNPDGPKINCIKSYDDQEEAEFVIREISSFLSNGISPADMAVFYRTNAQSRAIEEALFDAGIAYNIFGSHKFYERKEIKDIIAYYRLLLNQQDNEAFLRVINTPARGIGNTTVGKLIAFANQEKLSCFEAMERIVDGQSSSLSGAVLKKLKTFYELITSLRQKSESARKKLASQDSLSEENYNAIAELIRSIAEDSKYLSKLKSENTPEAESRIENITELMRVAADFVARNEDEEGNLPGLEDFLDRTSLASDLDKDIEKDKNEMDEVVSLMTLHLAKGLEFDVVFLLGLEEGLLPHSRSLECKEDLEEERRLFYVGVTRARKVLHLTRSTNRTTFGRNSWYNGMPSRFIEDIPDHLVEDRGSGFLENYY